MLTDVLQSRNEKTIISADREPCIMGAEQRCCGKETIYSNCQRLIYIIFSLNVSYMFQMLISLFFCFLNSDSPMPVTSRVCFVKFQEPESVGVSQHLTNTVFVDRALIVVPFAEGLSLHCIFMCAWFLLTEWHVKESRQIYLLHMFT